MFDLLPFLSVTGKTDEEKISCLANYLARFKEELEFILSNIGTDNLSAELKDELARLKASDETYATQTDVSEQVSTNAMNGANTALTLIDAMDYTDTYTLGYFVTKVDQADGVISVTREDVNPYIEAKINALDYTDSSVSGEFVTEVNETDGVISVTRASLPTKLSDFTDDVVSGNYLPLSGGTLTGTLYSTKNLMLEHSDSNNVAVARLYFSGTKEVLRLGSTSADSSIRLQNNSNRYGEIVVPSLSVNRIYSMPDASGTVALKSDIDEELAINMVKYPYYTSSGTTNNYITYTYGEDGIITMTGTASGLSDFVIVALQDKVEISPSTTYTFSGISGGSDSTYFIRLTTYDSNNSSLGNVDFYGTTTFTTDANAKYMRFAIYVRSGITVNETISPMLEKGDTTHSYKRYCGEGEALNDVLANNFNNMPTKLSDLTDDVVDGVYQKQVASSTPGTSTYTVASETGTNVCTMSIPKGINIIRVGVSVPNDVTNTDFTMIFNTTSGSETVATGTTEHQHIGNPIGSKRTVLDFVYTGVFASDTTFYANLMHNNASSITLYVYARIINIPT